MLVKIVSLKGIFINYFLDEEFILLNPISPAVIEQHSICNREDVERIWISIPKNASQLLLVGDTIKLGRAKLKVDRIYTKKYIEDIFSMNLNTNIRTQNSYLAAPKDKNNTCS